MLSGPAETGKTIATLYKLHSYAIKYPGSQHVILRKTYSSAVTSVVQSFIRKIILPADNVVTYGGERPSWFDYPNGSRIWVAGMDSPDKVLSSERDTIYVNQAEELSLVDWEYLMTRSTGRAGNMPFGQLFGDCNPGPPSHWIRSRASMRFLESKHEDNPVLFKDDGTITEQGKRTMRTLNSLTGIRKERLRYGRWVSAEGVVYEFAKAGENPNLIDHFDPPPEWRRIRVVDFGYSNPFVCQFWAMDNDDRMYLYREIYHTKRTVAEHIPAILRLSGSNVFEATVADHDSGDRATLDAAGIDTIAAQKSITVGIQAVQSRIAKASDGKPRLFVMRGALDEIDERLQESRKPTNTAEEFDTYMWPLSNGKALKEVPIKVDDHGMDAMRYAVMYMDSNDGRADFYSSPFGGYRG